MCLSFVSRRIFASKYRSMEGWEDKIREELQKLIEDSCNFDRVPSEEFQKFHRVLLRFSFDALSVELNYENKTISVWNSKPSNIKSLEMGDFQNAIFEKVNYTNLEETLLGCVAVGVYNERFYKHLLCESGRLPSEEEMKIA